MTRITVELSDDALLAAAERAASEANESLSQFVAQAISEAVERHTFRASLHPIARRWAGALPTMSDDEMDDALRERRERKYGP
jgi:hypothetical protein